LVDVSICRQSGHQPLGRNPSRHRMSQPL
jgi:hypothetical protein